MASANDPTTGTTLFFPQGLGTNLRTVEDRLIDWNLDLVGRFGWADHAPPGAVTFGWTLLILVFALFVLLHGSRRDRIGLTVLGGSALILTPLVAIATVVNSSAYEARYHLPLAMLVILGLTVAASRFHAEDGGSVSWSILSWGARLVPLAMLISVAASLHRYSIGGEAQLADLATFGTRFKEWLPPSYALFLAAMGLIGTATAVLGFLWGSRNPDESAATPESRGRAAIDPLS